MPKNQAHTFKVGLMVSVGLLVLSILILISGDFRPFRSRYQLTITFNDVAGLDVNSPVRLVGMEVGEVKEMYVRDGKINVVILIDREAKIRRDTKATINSMGLIGEKYVGLTMGETGPHLKDGESITGIDPVSIGEMLSRGEIVVEKIEGMVKALDKIFSETEILTPIEKILKNIEAFTLNLDSLLKENREGITGGLKDLSKSSKELKEVVGELKVSTREISSKVKGILTELDRGFGGKGKDIEEIITRLKVVSNRLTLTIDSLQEITQKVKGGEGLAGKILFDEKVAQDLGTAIKDLKELSADLKAHPWKLMRKK